MKCGFSFCGVDIKTLGLEYVPELRDTYAYAPGETSIHDETYEGHTGGYFYGAWAEPKEFYLRCYFENKQIDHGVIARIYDLFRVGRAGKLIFTRRPWCYYNARVIKPVELDLTNYRNGLVLITMKAYFPYSRCDKMYDSSYDVQILNNTGLFDSEDKVPQTSFSNINSKNSRMVLANPGTEITPIAISISGDVKDGLCIENLTTKQKCTFVNITDEVTSDIGAKIVCDGLSGKVAKIDTYGEVTPGYLYHKEGFISLEPCFPVERNIFVKQVDGNTITVYNNLLINYEGQYIFINGWYKITEQPDAHTIIVEKTISNPDIHKTTISRMNELNISFVGQVGNVKKLEFNYKPMFA